jgi:hypothetical protein
MVGVAQSSFASNMSCGVVHKLVVQGVEFQQVGWVLRVVGFGACAQYRSLLVGSATCCLIFN